MREKESFSSRWSRLKREEAAEAPPAASAPEAAPAEDDRPDEEILAELGLPHPDDLKPGDDFSGFLQAAVPQRLRRMALRSLWRSNPVLANVDGLVDYGDDFTDAAVAVEKLETIYQVGKGMLRDLAEADDAEEPAPQRADAPEPAVARDGEMVPDSAPEASLAEPMEATPEDAPALATTRRMAFRFDGVGDD